MQVLRNLGLDRWIWLNMYISFFWGEVSKVSQE
jgi:hypothetical protein